MGASGIAVTVNGQSVGKIPKSGRQECVFAVSAAVLGTNPVARLELAVTAWKPSAHQAGNGDTRDLGVSVRQVEVIREGAGRVAATSASLRMVVNRERLAPYVREIGKGKTVCLSGMAEDAKLVAGVLAALLPNAVDGRLDGRFATETDGGVLWFDASTSRINANNER